MMLYYKMDSESKPSFCQKNSVHIKFNLQIIPNCKVFNFCQPIVCTESSHIMRSWKIYLKNNLLYGCTLYQERDELLVKTIMEPGLYEMKWSILLLIWFSTLIFSYFFASKLLPWKIQCNIAHYFSSYVCISHLKSDKKTIRYAFGELKKKTYIIHQCE